VPQLWGYRDFHRSEWRDRVMNHCPENSDAPSARPAIASIIGGIAHLHGWGNFSA
jgi:hypothetical protein